MEVTCPYCGDQAKLVTGAVIYPHRPDLNEKKFWQCAPCGAYVGCHKPNNGHGDGTRPLGRLANAELRAAKIAAHACFDPIWVMGEMARAQAYKWLASGLGIETKNCHIGMFDVETCKKVVTLCKGRQ